MIKYLVTMLVMSYVNMQIMQELNFSIANIFNISMQVDVSSPTFVFVKTAEFLRPAPAMGWERVIVQPLV